MDHHAIAALQRAIDIVGGTQRELADRLGVVQSQVSSWAVGRRPVPARHCLAIERITGGSVQCAELRPEIFAFNDQAA